MRRWLPAAFLLSLIIVALGLSGGCRRAQPAVHRATIADIQGHDDWSPLDGVMVATEGTVTAVAADGIWIQDGNGAGLASCGIRVLAGTYPLPAVGDRILATGLVREHLQGFSSIDLTETVLQLDAAVQRIGSGDVQPLPLADIPIADEAVMISSFWERYEGMLVALPAATVSGPLSKYGEVAVLPGDVPVPVIDPAMPRQRPPIGRSITLDSTIVPLPVMSMGDRLAHLVGVVGYAYGSWRIRPISAPAVAPANREPAISALAGGPGFLTVASFNVENLNPAAGPRLPALGRIIADNLHGPDLLALQEVQDNNGSQAGVVDATRTCAALLATMPELPYQVAQIDPIDGQDGGQPDGNIRSVFLWRADRITFTPRRSPTPRQPVQPVPDGIFPNPGLIDPDNPAFLGSRKPLAACFQCQGHTFVVINVHLNSRRGDSPFFGKEQPPQRRSQIRREQQVAVIADFIRRLRRTAPDMAVILMGDCNDSADSPAFLPWADVGLINPAATLPTENSYSYLYQGLAQMIDQIWISPPMAIFPCELDPVHVNTPFPADRKASDHDPVLMRIQLPTH